MDANDRNESTVREREAKLARRLGEALDQLNPQGAGSCPDAEIIAAFSERALGADELAQCESHIAICSRCRNILKVLAAASDTPLAESEVAELGQRVAAVSAPIEITAGAAKLPRSKAAAWSTRWLAPAFGVAAVLTVWFVLRPPWRAMDRSGSTTLIAQAPREEMPVPAPRPLDRVEKSAAPPETPPAKTEAPNATAESSGRGNLKSRDSLQEISPNAGLAKSLPAEKKEVAPPESGDRAKTLAAPTLPSAPPSAVASAMNSPAPLPQMRARADSVASAANSAPTTARQSAEVNEAAPRTEIANGGIAAPVPQQPSKDVPLNGRNFQALSKLQSDRRVPILLKPSSGTSVWRAGTSGVIERSTDQGKTWTPQTSPSGEDWLAGAAISDSVCWLAGRNGAIARTEDSKNWHSISSPAQSAAQNGTLPDWTAVTAQDAQSVVITATDGAKFATSDGGKTWLRLPQK